MFERINKWALRVILYTALLVIANLIGSQYGVILPINFATIAITSIFRIPGLIALILLKVFVVQ